MPAAAPAVTLDEAYRAAVSRSELVAQSHQQVAQADEKVAQLRGGLFPNLAFNAVHLIQPLPQDPVAQSFSPSHQTTLSFGLSQPLFRGLREFAGLRQQKTLLASRQADAANTALRLYLDLAANYLNILSLEQDLRNLGEQARIYEQRVKELGGRVRRGESSESEVLTAEATQASLAAETRLVQGQLEAAREMFQYLTGLATSTELSDPDLLASRSALAPLDTYIARVEERPDIRSAADRFKASEEGVSIAWGAHLPTVDLVANYYVMRPGFLKDLKWDVGLRLTLPLFQGGTTQAAVREAVSHKVEAELDLERLRRAAAQEIRSLHQRLRARLDHLEKLERSVELSEKNTQLLQRDYKRGLARNIDVQTALTELRVSTRNHDQSHYAAELELLQLKGAASLVPAVTATQSNAEGTSR